MNANLPSFFAQSNFLSLSIVALSENGLIMNRYKNSQSDEQKVKIQVTIGVFGCHQNW